MDMNQVLQKYLKLFETYFNVCETLDNIDVEVPKTSAYEKSVIATNYINIDDYINSIKLPIYKTEASDILFSSIRNIFASSKSVIELNKAYLDPTILSPELVNNLLKSFGFDYLDIPMIVKRRILTSLVKAYKIKGSVNSLLEVSKSVITNYNIKEILLKKKYIVDNGNITPTEVYFEWESDEVDVPGGTSKVLTKLPYNYVIDKHWWISYDKVLNTDISRQMSPFFVTHKTLNSNSIYKGIAYFKKRVYDDYITLMTSNELYNDRKIITIESLPEAFTHLELWYMIRYFWIYLNYYVFVDDVSRNYFHIDYEFVSTDILEQDYIDQFETRYTNKFGEIPGKYELKLDPIYIHAIISKINNSEVYRYTEDRKDYKLVSYQNKIIALFGTDSNGNTLNNLRVINVGRPGEETIINLPFWLTNDCVVFAYGNMLFISGGKFSSGELNTNLYIVNLDDGNVYISNNKYPNITYDGDNVNTVYNPYNRNQYVYYINQNNFFLFEQNTLESYPYLCIQYDPSPLQIENIEIFSYNTNSEVFVSLIVSYTEPETLNVTYERILLVYSSFLKTFKVMTKNDVSNSYIDLFDLSSSLYCFPYGNGFGLMLIDNENNIRQIFLETNNNVETAILTEYEQYPNNPNYSYKVNVDDYSPNLKLSQVITPYSSILYNIETLDILYHIKELTIDILRYNGSVIDYNCSNNDSAKCFKDMMLNLREEKLILDDNVLPTFSTVQELRDFLYSISPDNIDSFEKSPYKELTLFELLVTASQLTGVDLTSLMSSYLSKIIQEIVERFKPVYSRMIDLTTQMIIADPIGDWISLSDSKPEIILSEHLNELIALTEYLTINTKKYIDDSITISDRYIIQLALDIALNFFDGTIIGELDQVIYLGEQVTEITYKTNVISQQYITTSLDTGF